MIFNLSLIPIGNSYWVSATKIGTNYIKTFANPNQTYLRLSISNIIENHKIDNDWIYVTFPSGLKLKLQVFDFDNENRTNLYNEESILDIFNKVNTILIRNPLQRFKSGLVQKVSELYSEIRTAIETNTMNNVRFHNDIYFDLSKYPIDYELLVNGVGITPNEQNPLWKSEWNRFTEILLSDVFKSDNIDTILLQDFHTQPVYHFFYLILSSFSNWNTIKTLDINDLNVYSNLIIDEIGLDEYEYRLGLLNNRENWNTDINSEDYINTLKRVSNKRLYFESHLISEYHETTPMYIYENMYYNILSKKQYKILP